MEIAAPPQLLTGEAFDAIAALPENRDRLLELIGGRLVEVSSNHLSSNLGARIAGAVEQYLVQNDIGYATGADGGFRVMNERYIPDVAFVNYEKQNEPDSEEGYSPFAPDLAVEVLSPANDPEDMSIKIANYLAAGTVVWRVSPLDEKVVVFVPGQSPTVLTINDVLDGGDVLPGFQLPLKRIFRKKPTR